jgi:carbamoyltransferase
MLILGINETSHDASLSLIKDGQILFAGHAERYSKQKNDWYINDSLVKDALSYGTPDAIAYYEKPLLKASRLFLKGGSGDWKPQFDIDGIPRKSFKHHYSHACAGYYTSKFTDAVIVVLDAIGEYNTSTIWVGEGEKIKLKYKQSYPISFGLFYSAFTKLIGLMPNQEEYIMMGMAAYGDWKKYYKKVDAYFPKINKQKYNFHKGITDWGWVPEEDKFDIAAAVQFVYEQRLNEFMRMAYATTGKKNLVFMGGCALNSSANTLLWKIFDDVWIMPNPGDAGSSLGAAAAFYGKHIEWKNPYLGYDMGGDYPVQKIVDSILRDGIVAVASGRAEYGPRALGNRSILADARDPNIKDKVNLIKQRELFRPFAPVVMEEHAHKWFDMNFASPYMQYTVKCLRPELIPSVVHKDGTSRVQTVNRDQHKGLWRVLNKFYLQTGVPVLLNTSLNIKGQPLLNDYQDAIDWQSHYGYNILTGGSSLVG